MHPAHNREIDMFNAQVKFTARMPLLSRNWLDQRAKKNRRSMNDELLSILDGLMSSEQPERTSRMSNKRKFTLIVECEDTPELVAIEPDAEGLRHQDGERVWGVQDITAGDLADYLREDIAEALGSSDMRVKVLDVRAA